MRFDPKRLRKLLKDFQTSVENALFELAKVAAAHASLIREVVLRKPLFMAQSARMIKAVAIMLAFASVRQAVCFLARRSLPSR